MSRARTPRSRCDGSHTSAVEPILTMAEPSGALRAAWRRGVSEGRSMGPRERRHARAPTRSTAAVTSTATVVATVPTTLLIIRSDCAPTGAMSQPGDDGCRRVAPEWGDEAGDPPDQ